MSLDLALLHLVNIQMHRTLSVFDITEVSVQLNHTFTAILHDLRCSALGLSKSFYTGITPQRKEEQGLPEEIAQRLRSYDNMNDIESQVATYRIRICQSKWSGFA